MDKSRRTRRPGTRRGAALLAAIVGGSVLLSAPGVGDAHADPEQPVGGALLGSRGVVRPEGMDVPPLPKVKAASYVVSDLDTGKVLAAKDPHGSYAPASTLKVLTALNTLPYVDKDEKVRPKLADMSVDGTKVGVDRRRSYDAHSLFQAMLMMSANDAAAVLARAAGGSGGQLKTVARMNATAKRLQAYDTVAHKVTGLDAKGQVSSAYDLTLIFREAMKRDDFREYVSTEKTRFPALRSGKTYQIATHDRLLTEYQGMLGGKNGYTTKAKASYVGAAKRNGHTIGVSVMRTESANMWPETEKLLNWGFAARDAAVPVGDLVDAAPKPASPSASESAVREKDQAVTPIDDAGGLPPWLPPVGLVGAVLLCALVAVLAISGRRAAAVPAGGGSGRRRGGRRAHRPAHAPPQAAQPRRGHRRASGRRPPPADDRPTGGGPVPVGPPPGGRSPEGSPPGGRSRGGPRPVGPPPDGPPRGGPQPVGPPPGGPPRGGPSRGGPSRGGPQPVGPPPGGPSPGGPSPGGPSPGGPSRRGPQPVGPPPGGSPPGGSPRGGPQPVGPPPGGPPRGGPQPVGPPPGGPPRSGAPRGGPQPVGPPPGGPPRGRSVQSRPVRSTAPRGRQAQDTGVTASYPMWPND